MRIPVEHYTTSIKHRFVWFSLTQINGGAYADQFWFLLKILLPKANHGLDRDDTVDKNSYAVTRTYEGHSPCTLCTHRAFAMHKGVMGDMWHVMRIVLLYKPHKIIDLFAYIHAIASQSSNHHSHFPVLYCVVYDRTSMYRCVTKLKTNNKIKKKHG